MNLGRERVKQVDSFAAYEHHNSISVRIYLYLGFEGFN